MTDAERVEALLDLPDPQRSAEAENGARLVVLGLAVSGGNSKKSYSPTNVDWALLGDRGRSFQPLSY